MGRTVSVKNEADVAIRIRLDMLLEQNDGLVIEPHTTRTLHGIGENYSFWITRVVHATGDNPGDIYGCHIEEFTSVALTSLRTPFVVIYNYNNTGRIAVSDSETILASHVDVIESKKEARVYGGDTRVGSSTTTYEYTPEIIKSSVLLSQEFRTLLSQEN